MPPEMAPVELLSFPYLCGVSFLLPMEFIGHISVEWPLVVRVAVVLSVSLDLQSCPRRYSAIYGLPTGKSAPRTKSGNIWLTLSRTSSGWLKIN